VFPDAVTLPPVYIDLGDKDEWNTAKVWVQRFKCDDKELNRMRNENDKTRTESLWLKCAVMSNCNGKVSMTKIRKEEVKKTDQIRRPLQMTFHHPLCEQAFFQRTST
jgi:hypothetical protein